MSDAHTTTVDRLRLFETSRRATATDRLREAQEKDAAARGTFSAGSHVLDLVTGLDGVVQPTTATLSPASTLVTVRLDRGDLMVRRPDQLWLRPTPPSV